MNKGRYCFVESCSGITQSIQCVSRNKRNTYDPRIKHTNKRLKRDSKWASPGTCEFRGSVFNCKHGPAQTCEGRASLRCLKDESWTYIQCKEYIFYVTSDWVLFGIKSMILDICSMDWWTLFPIPTPNNDFNITLSEGTIVLATKSGIHCKLIVQMKA